MTDEERAEMHDDLAANAATEVEHAEHTLEAARLRAAEDLDPEYSLTTVLVDLTRIAGDRASEALPNEEAQGHVADLTAAIAFLSKLRGDLWETFGFTFNGEAGEYFLSWCDQCKGLTVRITTEEGEEFDAQLQGGDWNAEMYNTVLVKKWDDEECDGVGDVFSVVVRNVYVY